MRVPTYVHFHCAHGFSTRTLARMLDSLVRVSRRAACGHYASIQADAQSSAQAGCISPRAITLRRATFPRPLSSRPSRCWPARRRMNRAKVLSSNDGRVWQQALPFQQFHALFNSLSKVLFIFRSLYLCTIGLQPVFSFGRNLPPVLSCIPKQLDSSKELHMAKASTRTRGSHPL